MLRPHSSALMARGEKPHGRFPLVAPLFPSKTFTQKTRKNATQNARKKRTQKNATTNERKTRRARKRRKKTRSAITRKHRTKTQSRKRYATTKAERTRPVLGPSGGLIVCSALFVAPRQAKSWRIRVFMTVFYFSEELRKRDGLICFSDSRFGFRRAVFFLTIVRDRKCWHKKSRASKSSGNAGRLPQRRILPVVNTPDL